MSSDDGEREITQEYLQSLTQRIAEEDQELAQEVVGILNRAKALREQLDAAQQELNEVQNELEQLKEERAEQEESDDEEEDGSDEDSDAEESEAEDGEQSEAEDTNDDESQSTPTIDEDEIRAEARDEAVTEVMEDLFNVRDNLVRALDQADEDSNIKTGVEATLTQLDDVIDGWGVAVIDPEKGSEIEPEKHKVVDTVEGEQPEDMIEEVYREGYSRDGTVLRSAEVVVSNGAEEGDDDEESDGGE